MATTKTIQPTGTTITIPAMTDRPDASVFATDVDRITDAANALNSNLSNLIPGSAYIGDLNDLPTGRVYTGIGVTNAPNSGKYWFVDTILYGTNGVQYAQDRNTAVNVWTRNKSQGNWREWEQLALKRDLKKIVTLTSYYDDYTYNTWVTHTATFSTLTNIENAFVGSVNADIDTPHEARITGISGNKVTYIGKGMWTGGAAGIGVTITAIGS